MIFFTNNEEERLAIEQKFNDTITAEGQELIGWRTVPINGSMLSDKAKETAPVVRQVFIKSASNQDGLSI